MEFAIRFAKNYRTIGDTPAMIKIRKLFIELIEMEVNYLLSFAPATDLPLH